MAFEFICTTLCGYYELPIGMLGPIANEHVNYM